MVYYQRGWKAHSIHGFAGFPKTGKISYAYRASAYFVQTDKEFIENGLSIKRKTGKLWKLLQTFCSGSTLTRENQKRNSSEGNGIAAELLLLF